MAIITRFGGSGGGTPIVDPYPHVWECTVVQSGTTGVVSGVVSLEAYDILHYTMPLGFSTYDLMIGGVTYHTSFRNEGEMYIQWTGSDFVVVSANAACALPHVWTNPTYTITGTVLEITAGVEELHTNDVIVLTLASGESASNIEYNSQVYTIDLAISEGTNYVQFNGTTFDNALFNFKGNATASDVASGKTFYSSDGTLRTGSASLGVDWYGNVANYQLFTDTIAATSTITTYTTTIPSDFRNSIDSIILPSISLPTSSGTSTTCGINSMTISGSTLTLTLRTDNAYTYKISIAYIKFTNVSSITKRIGSGSPQTYVTTATYTNYTNIESSSGNNRPCTLYPVKYDDVNKKLTLASFNINGYNNYYANSMIFIPQYYSGCITFYSVGNIIARNYFEYEITFL